MSGHFIISLDFELIWGLSGWNEKQIDSYLLNINHSVESLRHIIEVLQNNNIKCTIGFVGALNNHSMLDLDDERICIPSYNNKQFSSFYSLFPYIDKKWNSNLFFASKVIGDLTNNSNIELASHTFSHYYCLEKGQSLTDFEKDLSLACDNASAYGIKLSTIIFPRNQVNQEYLKICQKCGFTHYRGTLNSNLYKSNKTQFRYSIKGLLRFVDSYLNISGYNAYSLSDVQGQPLINVPGSRFLRPFCCKLFFLERLKMARIKKSMEYAAKYGKVYHLWWHPHNFGVNMEENLKQLEEICKYFTSLQSKYDFCSSFISDIK